MIYYIPDDCVSLIDYVLKEIPNWETLDSICMCSSAYNKKVISCPGLKHDDNVFTREQSEDIDKCLPLLSFELKQVKFDMWAFKWIEQDGARKYFIDYPIVNSIFLTCE